MLALSIRASDDGDPSSTWLSDSSPEVRDALDPVFDRLDELADLPPGWETPDARPISATALDAARELLIAAITENGTDDYGESAVEIYPTTEGGVEIDWHGPNGELELTVAPTGALSYMLMTDLGLDRHFEEGELPDTASALRQVGRVLM